MPKEHIESFAEACQEAREAVQFFKSEIPKRVEAAKNAEAPCDCPACRANPQAWEDAVASLEHDQTMFCDTLFKIIDAIEPLPEEFHMWTALMLRMILIGLNGPTHWDAEGRNVNMMEQMGKAFANAQTINLNDPGMKDIKDKLLAAVQGNIPPEKHKLH